MPQGIPGSRGTCTIEDCDLPHKARGLCNKHYGRWQYRKLSKPRLADDYIALEDRQPFDLSDVDAAWLAGLFEGEGCISYHGPSSVRLQIQMTDRDVIERVAAMTTGREPSSYQQRDGRSKRMWFWQVGWRPDVEELLTHMMPWLGDRRRARAEDALKRLRRQTQPMRARYGA